MKFRGRFNEILKNSKERNLAVTKLKNLQIFSIEPMMAYSLMQVSSNNSVRAILLNHEIYSAPWADTLSWWWSLCVSMTLRAVPAGTVVPGRSNHAGLVEG